MNMQPSILATIYKFSIFLIQDKLGKMLCGDLLFSHLFRRWRKRTENFKYLCWLKKRIYRSVCSWTGDITHINKTFHDGERTLSQNLKSWIQGTYPFAILSLYESPRLFLRDNDLFNTLGLWDSNFSVNYTADVYTRFSSQVRTFALMILHSSILSCLLPKTLLLSVIAFCFRSFSTYLLVHNKFTHVVHFCNSCFYPVKCFNFHVLKHLIQTFIAPVVYWCIQNIDLIWFNLI